MLSSISSGGLSASKSIPNSIAQQEKEFQKAVQLGSLSVGLIFTVPLSAPLVPTENSNDVGADDRKGFTLGPVPSTKARNRHLSTWNLALAKPFGKLSWRNLQ